MSLAMYKLWSYTIKIQHLIVTKFYDYSVFANKKLWSQFEKEYFFWS